MDAARRVQGLLNSEKDESADCDLAKCPGDIPHAEPLTSIARRAGGGGMPGLVKAWLEVAGQSRLTKTGVPRSPPAWHVHRSCN